MGASGKTSTRERILDTALELFNDKGSHQVTTNHIAEAMGISPGNLYYHFTNKAHIIKEILARLIARFDSILTSDQRCPSGPDLLVSFIDHSADLIHAFRFIYIELAALINQDDEFKQMYQAIKARRAAEFELLFDAVSAKGVFQRPISSHERDALFFVLWCFAEGILTTMHTSNIPVDNISVRDHYRKIIYLLKPYLQPVYWSVLVEKMNLPDGP
jgi:AcrR family transcriptional regulator